MERAKIDPKKQQCQCHSNFCTIDASNTCPTHSTVVCNTCTSLFHFDCNVKIKNGKRFVLETVEAMKSLTSMIDREGSKYGLDKIRKEFRDEVSYVQDQVAKFENKISKIGINRENVDQAIIKVKKVIKSIVNSQAYRDFTDFRSKVQLCELISDNFDDGNAFGLRGIRTQFYMDAKKQEQQFTEGKLKGLALEINERVKNVEANLIQQEAESTQNQFKKINEKIDKIFNKLRDENKSSFDALNRKLSESDKNNQEQLNDLMKSLDKTQQKLSDFKQKQDDTNKLQDSAFKENKQKMSKKRSEVEDLKEKIDSLHIQFKNIDIDKDSVSGNVSQEIENIKKFSKKANDKIETKIEDLESSIKEKFASAKTFAESALSELRQELNTKIKTKILKCLDKSKSLVLDAQKELKSKRDSFGKSDDKIQILMMNNKINDMRLCSMGEAISYISKLLGINPIQNKPAEECFQTIDSLEKIYKIRSISKLEFDYNIPKNCEMSRLMIKLGTKCSKLKDLTICHNSENKELISELISECIQCRVSSFKLVIKNSVHK